MLPILFQITNLSCKQKIELRYTQPANLAVLSSLGGPTALFPFDDCKQKKRTWLRMLSTGFRYDRLFKFHILYLYYLT